MRRLCSTTFPDKAQATTLLEQEAVDALSQHKKSLGSERRPRQLRKSAPGEGWRAPWKREKNERKCRLTTLSSQILLFTGDFGGSVTKPACQYGVFCLRSEIEEENGYLGWPDETVTPTLKSSQIATLAATLDVAMLWASFWSSCFSYK